MSGSSLGFSFCKEVRVARTMSIAFLYVNKSTLTFKPSLGQHGLNKTLGQDLSALCMESNNETQNESIEQFYVYAQSHGTTDQQELRHHHIRQIA